MYTNSTVIRISTYICLDLLLDIFSLLGFRSVAAIVSLHTEADVPLGPRLVEHQR